MKLNDLFAEAAKDTTIDDEHLDTASTKLAYITSLWIQRLTEESLVYKKLALDFDELKRQRYEYFLTDHNLTLSTKEINEVFLPGDTSLRELRDKMALSKEKMRFIESTVKTLSQNSFNIKNAIQWQMFLVGR